MNKHFPIILLAIATLLLGCKGGLSKQQRAQKSDSVEQMITQGKELREHSDFMNALKTHQEALKIAMEIGDTLNIIKANNNVGTDLRRMGLLDEPVHKFRIMTGQRSGFLCFNPFVIWRKQYDK